MDNTTIPQSVMVASEAFAIKKAAEKYYKKCEKCSGDDRKKFAVKADKLTRVADQGARLAHILSNQEVAEKVGDEAEVRRAEAEADTNWIKLRAMIDLTINILY